MLEGFLGLHPESAFKRSILRTDLSKHLTMFFLYDAEDSASLLTILSKVLFVFIAVLFFRFSCHGQT